MKKIICVCCLLFLFCTCTKKQTAGSSSLFTIKAPSANNTLFDFADTRNNKASVFIFLATDCPLSQNYTLTLNNLSDQYKNDSIVFYGIIPGNKIERKDVDDFVNKYKINFQILLDADLNLTEYFGATKTPEVFVVNKDERILYQGAIDNWAAELGQHRKIITEKYLMDALNNIKTDTDVKLTSTKAIGCIIEKNS